MSPVSLVGEKPNFQNIQIQWKNERYCCGCVTPTVRLRARKIIDHSSNFRNSNTKKQKDIYQKKKKKTEGSKKMSV